MATLKTLRDERLKKLKEIRSLGIDPYPADAERTNYLLEVQDNFNLFENKLIKVVGRIKAFRKIGKIAFISIHDSTGNLQLFLKDDAVKADKFDKNN